MSIGNRYIKLKNNNPNNVTIVLAAKTRTENEIIEAIEAGATHFGHNYVQEAINMYPNLEKYNDNINWHLIGALQKNKINKILPVVNTIQTIDSIKLLEGVNSRAEKINKKIDIFLEINSGLEENKAGILPNYETIKTIAELVPNYNFIKLKGIMTMGKITDNKTEIRDCFKRTKEIYDALNSKIKNINLEVLSMGMSDSYEIAIAEGSNMIRVGTMIFGAREYK